MDINQLAIALIGASSTLLGAWLSSRSKLKSSGAPTKRTFRKTLIRFSVYFLLGGIATYWVMNWLLPFGRINERLNTLESHSRSFVSGNLGFAHTADSLALPTVPVGSVILSVLSPDRFQELREASLQWAPADGRVLDSLSRYVALTGKRRAPYLQTMFTGRSTSDTRIESDTLRSHVRPVKQQVEEKDDHSEPTLYWYVRIN